MPSVATGGVGPRKKGRLVREGPMQFFQDVEVALQKVDLAFNPDEFVCVGQQ